METSRWESARKIPHSGTQRAAPLCGSKVPSTQEGRSKFKFETHVQRYIVLLLFSRWDFEFAIGDQVLNEGVHDLIGDHVGIDLKIQIHYR